MEKKRSNKYKINYPALRNFVRNPAIIPSAKSVFINILLYAGLDGIIFPSQATLGKDFGLEPRQIRNLLIILRKFNVIRWKRGGYGRSNHYSISEEIYCLNDKQDGNYVSSNIGIQLPSQGGNTIPPNIVSKKSHSISGQLQQLFEETSKKKLHTNDLNQLHRLCVEYSETWVEDAIKTASKRKTKYLSIGYLKPILEDWKMEGKPPGKPVFHPCLQGKCNESGMWRKDNTYVICTCKQKYDEELKNWKDRWS